MSSLRQTSLVAGIFYLLTFVSIPTFALYSSVKGPDYILGPGPDTPVIVGSRILEAATIYVGIVSLLSVVTLRQAGAGAGALVTAQALNAQYYWSFLFGQSFIPAINGVLLGSLLYQSRLVPRFLPVLGFIGAALLIVSWVGTLSGLQGQVSLMSLIFVLPIAFWEFSLGIYLVVKGFRPSAIIEGM